MTPQILVNESVITNASSKVAEIGEVLEGHAEAIQVSSETLLGNWTGDGSASFRTASESLMNYLAAVSILFNAEASTLNSALTKFVDTDTQAAASF